VLFSSDLGIGLGKSGMHICSGILEGLSTFGES